MEVSNNKIPKQVENILKVMPHPCRDVILAHIHTLFWPSYAKGIQYIFKQSEVIANKDFASRLPQQH